MVMPVEFSMMNGLAQSGVAGRGGVVEFYGVE